MQKYYSEKLSAQRLQQCYQLASPRVRQYLEAEVEYVVRKIPPRSLVLELGCGYGRIIPALASVASSIIGIDNSLPSIRWGRTALHHIPNCFLLPMDAVKLAFHDHTFDVVTCIQNGISAFHVNQKDLIHESIRVTKRHGTILFSSTGCRPK